MSAHTHLTELVRNAWRGNSHSFCISHQVFSLIKFKLVVVRTVYFHFQATVCNACRGNSLSCSFIPYLSKKIFCWIWNRSSPRFRHAFTICSPLYMCSPPPTNLSQLSILPHFYLPYATCLPQSSTSLGSVKPPGFALHLWVRLAWPTLQSGPFQHRPLSLNFSLNKFASYLAGTDKLSV